MPHTTACCDVCTTAVAECLLHNSVGLCMVLLCRIIANVSSMMLSCLHVGCRRQVSCCCSCCASAAGWCVLLCRSELPQMRSPRPSMRRDSGPAGLAPIAEPRSSADTADGVPQQQRALPGLAPPARGARAWQHTCCSPCQRACRWQHCCHHKCRHTLFRSFWQTPSERAV